MSEIVLAGLVTAAVFLSQYLIDNRRAEREARRDERSVLVQTLNSTQTLNGADFSGADLSDLTLLAKSFRQTNFSDAELRNTTLSGSDLAGANLTGAVIEDGLLGCAQNPTFYTRGSGDQAVDPLLSNTELCVDFTRAVLRNTTIDRSQLPAADLSGSDLTDATITSTNLSNARFMCLPTSAGELCPKLDHARLQQVDLRGAVFGRHVDLRSTLLTDVCWDEATVWPADFDVPVASC